MYKIVPAERQGRSKETITKNRCKPSKKRLTAVIFGTPGETRTHYIPLRRRTLYPGEVRGHIQNLFNYTRLRDSNGSIVRRRSLYTTELQGHMQKYSIVQFRWTRDRRMLGGGRSILLSYRRVSNCGRADASPPGLRQTEGFAEQNLNAGGIHFPQADQRTATQTGRPAWDTITPFC